MNIHIPQHQKIWTNKWDIWGLRFGMIYQFYGWDWVVRHGVSKPLALRVYCFHRGSGFWRHIWNINKINHPWIGVLEAIERSRKLVGGFSPVEQHESNWKSSPRFGVEIETIWNDHPDDWLVPNANFRLNFRHQRPTPQNRGIRVLFGTNVCQQKSIPLTNPFPEHTVSWKKYYTTWDVKNLVMVYELVSRISEPSTVPPKNLNLTSLRFPCGTILRFWAKNEVVKPWRPGLWWRQGSSGVIGGFSPRKYPKIWQKTHYFLEVLTVRPWKCTIPEEKACLPSYIFQGLCYTNLPKTNSELRPLNIGGFPQKEAGSWT